jgi:hypothetical protein
MTPTPESTLKNDEDGVSLYDNNDAYITVQETGYLSKEIKKMKLSPLKILWLLCENMSNMT